MNLSESLIFYMSGMQKDLFLDVRGFIDMWGLKRTASEAICLGEGNIASYLSGENLSVICGVALSSMRSVIGLRENREFGDHNSIALGCHFGAVTFFGPLCKPLFPFHFALSFPFDSPLSG